MHVTGLVIGEYIFQPGVKNQLDDMIKTLLYICSARGEGNPSPHLATGVISMQAPPNTITEVISMHVLPSSEGNNASNNGSSYCPARKIITMQGLLYMASSEENNYYISSGIYQGKC